MLRSLLLFRTPQALFTFCGTLVLIAGVSPQLLKGESVLSEDDALTIPVDRIEYSLTEADAALIVQLREEAKEAAKDEREAELLSADIEETTVYTLSDHQVIFNRVKREKPAELLDSGPAPLQSDLELEAKLAECASRETVHIVLSGTVSGEGVSELWWVDNGERYRVFTNADFSLFGGVGEFEDGTTRYSVLSLVTPEPPRMVEGTTANGVTLADFSADALEYIVVEEGSDPEAFSGLEAMLAYYAENHERMRVTYENGQKLNRARQEYLKANPPKQRDIIINYAKD